MKLTNVGMEKVREILYDMEDKRERILYEDKDTADDIEVLPTIEDIEEDIELIAENGEYYNRWNITDHYNYPIYLIENTDYINE